jgi:hypothetical protein
MAEHLRDQDKPGYDLDYEAKYNAYLEWLDEQDVQREKTPYSKLIVFLCILTTIAYTVTCFFFQWNGKPIDSTLTLCFFGCYGIEFASLAAIKCSKNRHLKGDSAAKQMPKVEIKEDEDEVSKP